MNVFFTPYKISTITCNANISDTKNLELNLDVLYENLKIVENANKNFIWIQLLKEGVEKIRGFNPKKKRNGKKDKDKKNRFDNQITVIYQFTENYRPNIKIFKNGNIHVTGIRNVDHVEEIVNNIINDIRQIYLVNTCIIANINVANLKFSNLIIRMINSDFKSYINEALTEQYLVRRKVLHKLLINDVYNNKCSFQPGIYHGVKLEFFWNSTKKHNDGNCNCENHCFGKGDGKSINNCKKITIAIFESGSILITGGVNFDQIDNAYKYICDILRKHESEIRKSIIIQKDI